MCCACAIAVGGLTSPVKGPYAEPLYFVDKPPDSLPLNHSSFDSEEDQKSSVQRGITAEGKSENWSYDGEEKEADSKQGLPFCPQISESNHKKNDDASTLSELELRKLERGAFPPPPAVSSA